MVSIFIFYDIILLFNPYIISMVHKINYMVQSVIAGFIGLAVIWSISSCSGEKILTPTNETIYYTDIKYILDSKCATSSCHAGAEPAAKFGMETYEDILAGSIRGPMVYPERSDISMLYRTMAGISQPLMPEDKLLDKSIVDSVGQWINNGLFNSRD